MTRASPLAVRCLAGALLLSATAQGAGHVIAVLPLDAKMTKGKMDDASQASLEEMLRDVAVDALSSEGWTILTGETTLQILQDNGVDASKCGDQNCHLSMTREIKAEKFLSGAVQYADEEFTASIRLIDTATGRILASERIEGKTVKALRAAFSTKAGTFFARAGLTGGGEMTDPSTTPGRPASTGLSVMSDPAGASVRIDGDMQGKTPFRKELPAASYYVTLELGGYSPVTKQVTVEAGKIATFAGQLFRTAGFLEISLQPESARVTVDGSLSAAGKQGPFGTGQHTVHAEAPGYVAVEQTVVVENGIVQSVSLVLAPLPGKILVSTNVDADCEGGGASAKATPSGIGVLSVQAGSVTVTCTRDGYASASKAVTVERGKTVPVTLSLAKDDKPRPGQARREPKSMEEYLFIPGGTFRLGCEVRDTACFDNEKPGRSATVEAFWLGKTEVTQGAYARCVTAGACQPASDDPPDQCTWHRADKTSHPINCLEWTSANAYCTWIGGRLPTVEEWEFAAKSGESRVYPWGNEALNATRANICDKNCPVIAKAAAEWATMTLDDGYAATAPVGSYPAGASKWGLVDMIGNVWEWTSSDYATGQKEFRGAGWYDTLVRARNSHRLGATPATRAINLGMRCAFDK